MAAILIIEDDKTFGRILESFLTKNGFIVRVCTDGKEGLKSLKNQTFHAVLLDYRLPDTTGLEVLEKIREVNPQLAVIIMTGFSDIRTAVAAMKLGAREYITKPVNSDELLLMLKGILNEPSSIVVTTKKKSTNINQWIQGKSPASKQLNEYIQVVAPTDFTVIIEGESGTGKENVARTIHQLSKRGEKSFVAIDCGALSKELAASELFGHIKGAFTGAVVDKLGLLEVANGGTLFLDEVGNLSYEVQIKLLRAIQERVIQPTGGNKEIKVDVRIITATNESLSEKVSSGLFREDLYHRLNEFKLTVPALRERAEDIDEFVFFFQQRACEELSKTPAPFSEEFMKIMNRYDWPGNLRELKNVVRRAVLLAKGDSVDIEVLPAEMVAAVHRGTQAPAASAYDLKALSEVQERELIAKTLHEVKYNKSKAARLLNIDRKTLYLKMEKYRID
jgi:two-component system, NtrC family, response regulator HydG